MQQKIIIATSCQFIQIGMRRLCKCETENYHQHHHHHRHITKIPNQQINKCENL